MRDILSGNFALPRWSLWAPERIRAVNWNIDRGLKLEQIVEFLEAQRADILILQEVDLNARRTGFRDIAEEIARRLRMNYAFGLEFQELTQGRPGSPAFHGQATLSCWPVRNSRVIRFRHQSNFWKPKWYLPRTEPFQQRLGGRIALVTEIGIGGCRILTYNLHLESRGDKPLRMAQLFETVDDAKKYIGAQPVLLAGDLNLDLGHSYPSDAGIDGFHSAIKLPVPNTTTPRGLFRHRRRIDWVYLGGPVQSIAAGVCEDVSASDHYPIWFEVKLRL